MATNTHTDLQNLSTIPRLGKYVNDEIAYELNNIYLDLHKIKLNKVINEYNENFYYKHDTLWYRIDETTSLAINYRSVGQLVYIIRRYPSYYRIKTQINYVGNILKYWYTSGLKNPNGYNN